MLMELGIEASDSRLEKVTNLGPGAARRAVCFPFQTFLIWRSSVVLPRHDVGRGAALRLTAAQRFN